MKKVCLAARAASVLVCLLASVVIVRAQTVPSPWSDRDIGGPTLAGSASFSNGTFTIDAAGYDIWNGSDEFHFVYQQISGDIDVRARVDSVTEAHAWSKAGVMIRGSLEASAAHAYALVSSGKGVAFQRRPASGGTSLHTPGAFVHAPYWVRLVRSGTLVTAYQSADGVKWTIIASDTIALGSTAYVGIAVTSHQPSMRTTAAVSQVSIAQSGMPSGQGDADIGNPAVKGSASLANGTYTITAGGKDIWGLSDEFHYVYQPVTGDVDVVARVRSISLADRWSKAGVMIRESLAPGSRHAYALVSATRGYAFQRRVQTDDLSENTPGGTGGAPGWVRLVRSGTLFTAYRSADGTNWTEMGRETIPMGNTVYLGIAVCSHNVAAATTAVVDNLQVNTGSSAANNPPSVILSAPADNASFTAPATVTLTASATDSDGTVAGVEFYANSTLLGRDTSAPYTMAASSLPAGTYTLRAVATDDQGAASLADTVSISVTTAPTTSIPQWVVFQASADHATLVTKYVFEVYAANGTPGVSAPIVVSDLGKPTPGANNEIVVDRLALFTALQPGTYKAAVTAVAGTASARSAAVTFSR
jgi:regulation of enolase protein 1 (concanavalin A-like superfamily)